MDYYVLTPVSFALRNFEIFAQFGFMLNLLNKKMFTKEHFLGTVIFASIIEMVKMYVPQYLNGFVSILLGIIFITLFFREKLINVSLYYLFTGIVVSVIDCIVLFGMSFMSGMGNINNMVQNTSWYIVGCIIMSSLLMIIDIVMGYIKNKSKSESKNKVNHFTMSKTGLVNGIATFVLLIPNLAMILYYHDDKTIPLLVIIINICAIIAMFFVSTYNTKKGIELVAAEQELLTQRTYNKTLQNLVDGLRTFKHDYNNTLQTMYGYIQLENMSGLKNFFEQILDESRAITALDKLNPELFKNPSLFGIITAKFEYAKQNNVNINFEMYGKLEEADMQIYDLTRILGIFFDNAIEASTGSEKKKVNFMVYDRKDLITIEISNTYSEVGLKVEDLNKKGVSSKGENRGLGLYKVEEILKKYPSVKHETSAQNGMFRQKLVINKIKVKV